MEERVKYDGERIKLGDREFVIPCLTVKQAKRMWTQITELDKGITEQNLPEKYSSAVEVIHAALSRNYPDLKVDELEELLDVRNLRAAMLAVMGRSGLKPRPGDEPAAGPTAS
jgi:hypothetical protein